MTLKGPFQSQLLCDSVILLDIIRIRHILGMICITPRGLKLHPDSYTCSNIAFIHPSAMSNETHRMEGGL